jgi:ElaB/YqjD/DUF883 family membrane-anchored ribosome-binding protein
MSGMNTDPGEKSSAQIEREVERTRDNVADTLDTLRAKLQPGQMVDQVVEQITDYARSSGGVDFMRNLGTSVRDNPMPVALIGAGIAWLMMSRGGTTGGYATSNYTSHAYRPPAPPRSTAGPLRRGLNDAMDTTIEAAEGAVDALGNVVSRASSAASEAASRAVALGSDLASRVSEAGSGAVESISSLGQQAMSSMGSRTDSMRRMSSGTGSRGLEELAEAQPLLFGAFGLALGAALGAVLPRTEAEDRLMGEARDSMAERVGEAAREGMETVRSVAGEHLERVKDTLAETYQDTKENLDRGGLSGVGEALGSAAGNVTRVAEDALRGAVDDVKRGIGDVGSRTT